MSKLQRKLPACCIADFLIRRRYGTANAKNSSRRKPAGKPAKQQNKILRYEESRRHSPARGKGFLTCRIAIFLIGSGTEHPNVNDFSCARPTSTLYHS
jgi:hypothetical protein